MIDSEGLHVAVDCKLRQQIPDRSITRSITSDVSSRCCAVVIQKHGKRLSPNARVLLTRSNEDVTIALGDPNAPIGAWRDLDPSPRRQMGSR